MENLDKLINELRKQSNETQWVEFKHNNYDPVMIGQDISALANSATLYEKVVLICFGELMMPLMKLSEQITIYRR